MPGKAIGVAVADRATGPFKDVLGEARPKLIVKTASWSDDGWPIIEPLK